MALGASVSRDGWKNLHTALGDLMDSRTSVFDDRTRPHPAIAGIHDVLMEDDDVHAVQVRVREEGHVFAAEVFAVPTAAHTLGRADLDRLRSAVRGVDRKLLDVVVAPVRELPVGNLDERAVRSEHG